MTRVDGKYHQKMSNPRIHKKLVELTKLCYGNLVKFKSAYLARDGILETRENITRGAMLISSEYLDMVD